MRYLKFSIILLITIIVLLIGYREIQFIGRTNNCMQVYSQILSKYNQNSDVENIFNIIKSNNNILYIEIHYKNYTKVVKYKNKNIFMRTIKRTIILGANGKLTGSLTVIFYNNNIISYAILLALIFIIIFLFFQINNKNAKYNLLKNDITDKIKQIQEINKLLYEKNEEFSKVNKQQQMLNVKYKRMTELQTQLVESQYSGDDTFIVDLLNYQLQTIPEINDIAIQVVKGTKLYLTKINNLGEIQSYKFALNDFIFDFSSQDIKTNIFIKSINTEKQGKKKINIIEKNFANTNNSIAVDIKDKNNRLLAIMTLDFDYDISEDLDYLLQVQEAIKNFAQAFLAIRNYIAIEENVYEEILLAIIKIVEMYDKYTKGHSKRVADLSIKLGKAVGLSKSELNTLYWQQIVHDIGKILIPKSVLNKNGRLNPGELELIRQHPRYGYEVLKSSDRTKHIAGLIKQHHERWDGKGYPDGLKGEEISYLARIITIADQYDAMASSRQYRKALSHEEQLRRIKDSQGTQFDAKLQEIFVNIMEKTPIEEET